MSEKPANGTLKASSAIPMSNANLEVNGFPKMDCYSMECSME